MAETIMIAGERRTFDPDTISWRYQNPPAEFGFCRIGADRLFAKRRPGPGLFDGWGLIVAMLSRNLSIPNLPRVASIARLGKHAYLFLHILNGKLLDIPRLEPKYRWRIARHIVSGVRSINELGYYHPDLCPRNIMVDRDQAWLIDIDCCRPASARYSTKLPVSYELTGLLGVYGKARRAGLKIEQIPGSTVNQAEVIALASRLSAGRNLSMGAIHEHLLRKYPDPYHAAMMPILLGKGDWGLTSALIDAVMAT